MPLNVEAFYPKCFPVSWGYVVHFWHERSQWSQQVPNASALPTDLIEITRLQMLPKLVMALLFALAVPVCSPMPLLASPLPLWTCLDIFAIGGQFSGPAPSSCVDLQLSVASPILYGPCPWLTGAALCCSAFLLCGPAFWLVRAAVSCAWSNHVAPPIVTSHGSVKRQGPPSTHPPAFPSQSHALEQKLRVALCSFASMWRVSDTTELN